MADQGNESPYKQGTWNLYYWPGFRGRGDFARLMFEVAGVQYKDVCNTEGRADKVLAYYNCTTDSPPSFPVLAPPIIQHLSESGDETILSQSAAILHFLGTQFGLCPEGAEHDAHALQIALTAADYIAEGHDAFHPIKKTATYDSQKEEAQPFIEYFKSTRLPRYMKHLEEVYIKCNQKYFFKSKQGELQPTYADIAVYHALCATEASFNEGAWSLKEAYPKLHEFKELMDDHPKIKAYRLRDTTQKYCGNSLM